MQVWNSGYSAAVESPTSSSVSSPGNKATPVNFEFQPVTFDPVRIYIHLNSLKSHSMLLPVH